MNGQAANTAAIHTYVHTYKVGRWSAPDHSECGGPYAHTYVRMRVCMYVCMYAGTVMKGVLYRGYSLFFP